MTVDLTRWNRAGLDRFSYVDGNAVTFLERLREMEAEAFRVAGVEQQWKALEEAFPATPGESVKAKHQRWLDQYYDRRDDYAWEILRSLARSSHVLAKYIDAYANETFLGTASQWDSLRKLVAMLDYLPAPPASASTPLALLLKEKRAGVVDAGYAVKHAPEEGPPVIFETLEDLEADVSLNQLHCEGWNRSSELLELDAGSEYLDFPLSSLPDDLSVGMRGVLIVQFSNGHEVGFSFKINDIKEKHLVLKLMNSSGWPDQVQRHHARIQLQAQFRQAARLQGSDVVIINDTGTLNEDDVLAWDAGGWQIARISRVGTNSLEFQGAPVLPQAGEALYRASRSQRYTYHEENANWPRVTVPAVGQCKSSDMWDQDFVQVSRFRPDAHGDFRHVETSPPELVYYVPDTDPVARVQSSDPQALTIQGKPGKLSSGQWLLLETSTDLQAAKLLAIDERESDFTIDIDPTVSGVDTVIGDFSNEFRPADHDIDTGPVFETEIALRSDQFSTLVLEETAPWDVLSAGRDLVIASSKSALAVKIKEVIPSAKSIKVEPAIPGSELTGSGTSTDFPRFDTVVYGNVVLAGHGVRENEKILGSGDASSASQSFVLEVDDVSFVADGSFPAGVRADLQVIVDGRTWQQVPTLNWSGAEDHHYTVELLEDRTLKIVFGNGERGRLLPTGRNNVRATCRRGNGLSGNLPPYSLDKEFKPHRLIEKGLQHLYSSGGNDLEDIISLRSNAPKSVLTLERAVSLSDFTSLASAFSGIWQALAVNAYKGKRQKVVVVVMPAGGGPLGNLQRQLRQFLLEHAAPGIDINVIPYREVRLQMYLEIQVNEQAFQPEVVADSVRQALVDSYRLRHSKLGQDVFRSQLIATVESVAGVENCALEIFPDGVPPGVSARTGRDGAIRRVSPELDQAVFVADVPADLEIRTLPYEEASGGTAS